MGNHPNVPWQRTQHQLCEKHDLVTLVTPKLPAYKPKQTYDYVVPLTKQWTDTTKCLIQFKPVPNPPTLYIWQVLLLVPPHELY